MELYLSDNQGFRFALDDMNVTTSTGKTYDLTPALGDGYSDGSKYPDGSGKYLTQSEMTDIISYAAGKGIDIVPCINVPGHMGAILEKFTQFKYSGSNSSIDLENAEAVAFALAITEKYATYFGSQGVKFYNLGADEYANDLSTMGFQGLYTSGKYQKFVEFLNNAAQIVINHGMTPRAFNDGIYYKEDNAYSINPAIQICYWSCGWSGYNLASAQYLVNQDMDVINTHGDYYWVLGNTSWQCSPDKASQFDYTSFQYRTGTTGNGTISDPAGAMFCIWCDVGNANGTDDGAAVVSATADVIAAFGAALPASETDPEPTPDPDPVPSEPVEVTKNETITVTVGQTETATISDYNFAGTYTTEDPSIATVEVTGKDAVEATTTYTKASVTCNTLIAKDRDNWTAVSGYYYKADDGNYYPVYAKRSRSGNWIFGYTYKYTWGYSTTTSTSDVAEIDTQSTTETSTTPNITVYTKSGTEATPASTTVTFTGVAVGTTYVTVGNTRYTINVVAEDLNAVTPLTVEYWITNRQVTAEGDTSKNIAASASGVYSENGVLFSSLVPDQGTAEGNPMDFWKGTRLASDNKQTNEGGVDKTTSGTDFTYIRYWDFSWAYSSDGKTWTNVESGDQIVAYYLQRTDVTDEITTQVVDWGPKRANWGDLNYLGNQYVLLDYTVKYESGEETPSAFPTEKSLGFHCATSTSKDGNYYRTLGMIRGVENANYEVYMITVTPTSDKPSQLLASTAAGNTSYTYGGTEVVAWAATQDDLDNSGLGTYTSISGNFTYSIGGEPIVNGLEIYRRQGMKVTFYVRAKVTEDSLAVHYIDQTANQEFYSYNIAVQSGTLFNENIGLADPWMGNLANGSVTNLQNKTQTVSADLSTMPAIGVQYRFSDYTCVRVERSEDGKNVYLYYTFNNTHSFVVDFGLPVEIPVNQIISNIGTLAGASIAGAKYGSAVINADGKLVYTPTKMLGGVESLTLTITEKDSTASHQIYIYPATTVYYEEGFATYSEGWTGTDNKGIGTQETQATDAGRINEYGYDAVYDGNIASSNGSKATSSAAGNTCDFTFTGTGFEVYANCTTTSGYISSVVIRNEDGAAVKAYMVNTVAADGTTDATTGQATTLYSLPIISEQNLAHGTYKVTITHIKNDSPIYIDGFRIYGTMKNEPEFYKTHLEDQPVFIELRDRVLASLNATANTSDQYADQIASNIHSQVYEKAGNTEGVVITTSSPMYTGDTLKDLLDNGPKNEIFLQSGQALIFTITTNREVQIGLKAPSTSASYTIKDDSTLVKSGTMNSSTDMFYKIVENGDESQHTITITNSGSGILSVTKLKVCDDPNATLGSLTEEDLIPAMLSLGYELDPNGSGTTDPIDPVVPIDPVEPPVEPEEPEVTYADAALTVSLVDYTGKQVASAELTANGVEGKTKAFTAEEVLAAAKANVPEGYDLVDESKVTGAEVVYGESGTVTVQIGKTAALKVIYVNLRGKNIGTAAITKVQTSSGNCKFSASEIRANAPANRRAVWLTSVRVPYGSEMTIIVPVF